ncbi:MAG: iron ABC transporter permease [Desulfamplus sp.]|nr:iron ABC transporter permease [Desulfamplus sp.]
MHGFDKIFGFDKWLIPLTVGIIPVIFLGIFYFYPLSGIFIRSFFEHSSYGEGNFSMLSLLKIFQSSRMAGIIWFTFWQAFVSTILTLIAALPCAWVMGTFDFRCKKLVMTLATLPFVLPTIVVASAFQVLASTIKNIDWIFSFIQPEHSITMILFAHLFYNFSVVLRITSAFWSSLGKEMKEAASMLGANGIQVFFKITLPLLKPAILASSMLVFIFCFSSFGVILILGGPSFSTLEVEIYRQAAHMFNLPVASCLSLFQILCTFAMMWVYTLLQKKTALFIPESEKFSLRKPDTMIEKSSVFLCVAFIFFLCVMPISALVINSLYYKGSLSLIFYRELFLNSSGSIFYISPVDAISNSLTFALSTLAIALVVGGCAAYLIRKYTDEKSLIKNAVHQSQGKYSIFQYSKLFKKLLEPLFMLPLATSAVTLGFGMIITLDKPPLDFRTSVFLIPIVHTLVAFPFVVRAVLPALRAIPTSLKEAASIMGASPFKVWLHIELPIIARGLSIGAVFAFTVSLGEFGATLFAARPEFTTMPVTIYRFLGQPGIMNYGQAMAMSSILMLVTAIGFFFIENMRQFGHEGF